MAKKNTTPTSKSVAKSEATSTKLATRPKDSKLANVNMAALLEADQGAGSENIGREDLAIPRIGIIQSNSPQVKKADGKFIKGAEEGDFLDSVSNEVYAKGEDGFLFVPVSYRRANIEWIPRTAGGGFVADHGADDSIFAQCTKDEATGAMMLKNGHEVVTTAEYIGFALDLNGKNPRQVAISLAKTQLKEAKRLNTKLTTLAIPRANGQGSFNPAFFYSVFKCVAIPQTSKQGQSYMGWQITRHCDTLQLPEGQQLYLEARMFKEAISKGDVKVAQPADIASEPESDDSSL